MPELYGRYSGPDPGQRVLWFHSLSVGESFGLLPLIDVALKEMPDAEIVVTTSTASSVEALARADLPDRCRHILLPIDTSRATRAFLDHWKPTLADFAELDFRPRLMIETHRRGIPIVLINSRMPEQKFLRRQRLGGTMGDVLALFDRLVVEDELSRDRFVRLGAAAEKVEIAGALKPAARPLPADENELTAMKSAIGNRPVWCAAATEATEHAAMIEAYRLLSKWLVASLLVLAPRFKEDAADAERLARDLFPSVARRSRGQPLLPETQVYIADTFGEMGLWYRLAPVSFVGHSLTEGLEGKNPFGVAVLGSAILTGPHVSYFQRVTMRLRAKRLVSRSNLQKPSQTPLSRFKTMISAPACSTAHRA